MLTSTLDIGKDKLPFSVADFNELVVNQKTHKVVTRINIPVRVVCTDKIEMKGNQPIIYLIYSPLLRKELIRGTTENGMFLGESNPSDGDIFLVSK